MVKYFGSRPLPSKKKSQDAKETQTEGLTDLAQLLVFMLILLRQYTKICPSLRTTDKWESSVAKRAEGRESGHRPMARMELPQVSCARKEKTCFSSKAWASWLRDKNTWVYRQHTSAISRRVLIVSQALCDHLMTTLITAFNFQHYKLNSTLSDDN